MLWALLDNKEELWREVTLDSLLGRRLLCLGGGEECQVFWGLLLACVSVGQFGEREAFGV